MTQINQHLLNLIPEEKRELLGYYPDVLPYQDSKQDYTANIGRFAKSDYLYTNGYEIKPIGFWGYNFQRLKGYLGFMNYCDPTRVKFALCKYGYYGYLNGYPNSEFIELSHHGIDNTWREMLSRPRTNDATSSFQEKLVSFYNERIKAPLMNHLDWLDVGPSSFGDTWGNLEHWWVIPLLDPQDETIISSTVDKLEFSSSPGESSYIVGSKYALAVAAKCVETIKEHKQASVSKKFINFALGKSIDTDSLIDKARKFSSNIALQHKELFIQLYLEKKKLNDAFSLIEKLEDIEEAKKLMLRHYNQKQIAALVKKDSRLALALARHYIKPEETYEPDEIYFAAQFDSNFIPNFPTQGMRILIHQARYDDAYNFFEKPPRGALFFQDDIDDLANYFEEKSKQNDEEINQVIKQKQWATAETLSANNMELMKKVVKLDNKSSSRRTRYIKQVQLYAQSLVEQDLSNEIKFCNIENITKAINILKLCPPDKTSEKAHQKIYAKALMRQADYMIYQVSIPGSPPHRRTIADDALIATHTKNHAAELLKIKQCLENIITMLKGTTDKELKFILGKASYMMGELNYFFYSIREGGYFRMAYEAVPDNPVYTIRYSEFVDDKQKKNELLSKGIPSLKNKDLDMFSYIHWFDGIFYQEPKPALKPMSDAHSLTNPKEEQSLLQQFKNIFS